MEKTMEGTDDEIILERMVDKYGTTQVLCAYARICHGKAAHVQEAWQDLRLAKAWEKNAKIIEKITEQIFSL